MLFRWLITCLPLGLVAAPGLGDPLTLTVGTVYSVGTVEGNAETTEPSMFRGAGTGDLHLRPDVHQAIDRARPIYGVQTDIDGDPRPRGLRPDVGADEYHPNIANTAAPSN